MMGLNKSTGNMYNWCSHTINFVKGWPCYHNCIYCYIKDLRKRWNQKDKKTYLDSKEFKTKLGKGNIIFVGSSTDMFSKDIPSTWIEKILEYCSKFDNKYLFQSKNPARFLDFIDKFPKNIILGTTIESNRDYNVSNAPKTNERIEGLLSLKIDHTIPVMISIEPILDFDPDILLAWINTIKPVFVSIGADSKNNNLPEPSASKLDYFIKELKSSIKVKLKDNLKRLR